ncbi:MAG: 7-carboxy-7-deazaguanine synthase QueE [Thermoplasmata archaeon]|nr:MAG: 7-carboxy-7-deazaguanine synthase QueE [Thermoplasmata archaeon]HEC89592.1 radical SAM protein [Thermoplasmatales archaeon]
MRIYEIFYSLQGEGRESGIPTIFIRTVGCNLRCTYCDTTYAYTGGEEIDVEAIIRDIRRYPCRNVCITGGEPLLQEDVIDLISRLTEENYKISIETNGSISIKPLLKFKDILISLDIKCPSSHMQDKMDMRNLTYLKDKDQLKFIIYDRVDYEYAKEILDKHQVSCPIFFQPVWGVDPSRLADWILKDGLQVYLGLQIHKIIWGEGKH